MSLSREDKEDIGGLLAAALRKPVSAVIPLAEKFSAIDMIRKWIWIVIIGAIMVGSEVERRINNSRRITRLEAKMKEVRPLVRKMWWQVEQGYTNHDLKEMHIKAPEFPEDD